MALLGKGLARTGQKRNAEAIDYYEAAAKAAQTGSATASQTDTLATVLINLGWSQYLAGDPALAQATLGRAISLVPEGRRGRAAPHISLGDIACAQGDVRGAEQHFEQADAIVREQRGSPTLIAERLAKLPKTPSQCNKG